MREAPSERDGASRILFPDTGQTARMERAEEQYGRRTDLIDYSYANYDIAAVEADYEQAADELARAQMALDAANQQDTFELPV